MTKSDLKALAQQIAEQTEAKGHHVHVGTWMERPGVSIEIRRQSDHIGKRVVIHKWDDEETCNVRYITGTWWRPKNDKQVGVEFWRVDDVAFDAAALAELIRQRITTREG